MGAILLATNEFLIILAGVR